MLQGRLLRENKLLPRKHQRDKASDHLNNWGGDEGEMEPILYIYIYQMNWFKILERARQNT